VLALSGALVGPVDRASAKSGDDPDVWDYAKKCFDRIELKDHDDLKGPFECKSANAKPLRTQVNGQIKDQGVCDPKKGSCPSTFPQKCDYPAWLELSSQNCYGHSYVQQIKPKSNPDVTAALLCRHKNTWTDDAKKFEDVAMIVHNEKNGETCWFQSSDSPPKPTTPARYQHDYPLDGTKVPGPETVRDHKFWMTPVETAAVMCVRCHDNGAFMNSRWMDQSGVGLSDGSGKYKNSEPPFDAWPTPHFVSAGPSGNDECTSCHKIAAGGVHKVELFPTFKLDMEFQTCADCKTLCSNPKTRSSFRCTECRGWIQRVTGRTSSGKGWSTHPLGADAAALKDDTAIWMPDYGSSWKRASWDKQYKTYVDHLAQCCAAVGESIKTGKAVTLKNCKESVP
jgi:hypothetical protein